MKKVFNMGTTDRVIRGVIGSLLLINGAKRNKPSFLFNLVGGSLLTSALWGHDPLLAKLKLSTVTGSSNNIVSKVKAMLPGHGINPILTQELMPKGKVRPYRDRDTVCDALAIG